MIMTSICARIVCCMHLTKQLSSPRGRPAIVAIKIASGGAGAQKHL